jgi:hypothetical protein
MATQHEDTVFTPSPKLRQGARVIAVTGIGLVGYGLTFLYSTYFGTGFELGVATLGGTSRAELAATNPEMLHYMDHLHVGLGGLLVALGIAIVALAWCGIQEGHQWALTTTLVIAVVALATNFVVHFDPGFGYDWLVHIAPSILVTVLVIGGVGWAYQGLRASESHDSGQESSKHG